MSDTPTLSFPAEWLTSPAHRRRTPEELVEDWGPLEEEHVAAVVAHVAAGQPASGLPPPSIQTIRHTHHRLAQLLAVGGLTDVAAGRMCGYSPQRVYLLRQDPAFQELLAHYAGQRDEEFIDAVQAMADLGIDLIQKFREYLEEQPEKLTPQIVLEGLKIVNDRAGLAPINRSVSVNLNAGLGNKLKAGRERAAAAELLRVTSVEAID